MQAAFVFSDLPFHSQIQGTGIDWSMKIIRHRIIFASKEMVLVARLDSFYVKKFLQLLTKDDTKMLVGQP